MVKVSDREHFVREILDFVSCGVCKYIKVYAYRAAGNLTAIISIMICIKEECIGPTLVRLVESV